MCVLDSVVTNELARKVEGYVECQASARRSGDIPALSRMDILPSSRLCFSHTHSLSLTQSFTHTLSLILSFKHTQDLWETLVQVREGEE